MTAAVAAYWVGMGPVLVAEAVVLAGAGGYHLGWMRATDQAERAHAAMMLGTFSAWAERALTAAPEELPPDQEQMRQMLQADYQEAQRILRHLEG